MTIFRIGLAAAAFVFCSAHSVFADDEPPVLTRDSFVVKGVGAEWDPQFSTMAYRFVLESADLDSTKKVKKDLYDIRRHGVEGNDVQLSFRLYTATKHGDYSSRYGCHSNCDGSFVTIKRDVTCDELLFSSGGSFDVAKGQDYEGNAIFAKVDEELANDVRAALRLAYIPYFLSAYFPYLVLFLVVLFVVLYFAREIAHVKKQLSLLNKSGGVNTAATSLTSQEGYGAASQTNTGGTSAAYYSATGARAGAAAGPGGETSPTEVPSGSGVDPWQQVPDANGSGQTYWWNSLTGEVTALGAPKPVTQGSAAAPSSPGHAVYTAHGSV